MKSNIALYLDAVDKELVCGRKRRKALMQQFTADIEDFADEHGGELTMQELEFRFGTAGEVAESLLKQTDVPEIRKLVNKKKIIIACVTVTCALLVIAAVCYLAHQAKLKEDFANGYYVETIYERVDGTPPPEPEDAQIY